MLYPMFFSFTLCFILSSIEVALGRQKMAVIKRWWLLTQVETHTCYIGDLGLTNLTVVYT